MIIVELVGGLGNQMFQYAFGRVLALLNQDVIRLDTSFFDLPSLGDTIRRYELDVFNISGNIAKPSELKHLKPTTIERIFTTLTGLNFGKSISLVKEGENHSFQEEVMSRKGDLYLSGYWQSYKYFQDHEDVIRKEFYFAKKLDLKNSKLLSLINNSQSVSIHVRRGDYLTNPSASAYHGLCPLSYYQSAIQHMKIRYRDAKFFVFSDDPEWVQKNLNLGNEGIIVEGNSGHNSWKDMLLMSKCKHNIVANSSFSWWGAWLNSNQAKTVIAPKKWFNANISTADLIPDNWVRI